MTVIEFDHVTKTFRRHAARMLLRDRLKHAFTRTPVEGFTALHDVSFRVAEGECMGIVGHNGAGKSTLLNLMTGLCLPTSGKVSVHGRIAPLLELGSGFHEDLTGAENLRMCASLMGFSRSQTERRAPEIIEFAGVADFIQEPLRTYSTGMKMRLAFAIAIHLDPEILIIDEVLGVGDASFFQRCTERFQAFRRAGKTMIIVSHSPLMIHSLCDRALWLNHGHLLLDGAADEVLNAYRDSAPQLRELAPLPE